MKTSRYGFLVLVLLSFFFVFPQSLILADSYDTDSTTSAREVIRTRLQETREEKNEMRQQAMDEFKEKREEQLSLMETRREEFRNRLNEIKDQRKARLVEDIDVRIQAINTKWVNNWQRSLGRLSDLLVKVESRVATAKDEGYDTAQITSAIETAKVTIASAESALVAQGEKEYIISITDESALRTDVQTVMTQLRSDLSEVKSVVETAHESVRSVISLLKDLVKSELAQ